jgi:hypothetical protein
MTNDLKKQNGGQAVVKYGELDGFALAARGDSMGIVDTKLRYCKAELIAGRGDDEEILPFGTQFVVDMDTLYIGFVQWDDGAVVDAHVVRVADGEKIPQRRDLGNNDRSLWPVGPNGSVKDPISPDARVYMVAIDPPHEGYTFVSSSWGGRQAMQKLCKAYVDGRDEHPGEMPIVAAGTFKRTDRNFGKIDTPTFEVVGWAAIDDVKAGAEG